MASESKRINSGFPAKIVAFAILAALAIALVTWITRSIRNGRSPSLTETSIDPRFNEPPDAVGPPMFAEAKPGPTPTEGQPSDSEVFEPPSLDLPTDPLQAMAEIKWTALESADELAESFPDHCEAVAVAALAQGRFGKSAEVIRRWEKCLELNQNFVDAYQGLGDVALEKGDYQRAIALGRRALEVDPRLPNMHALLGEALMGEGRMDEAVEVFRQGLEHFPDSTELNFRLGQACLQLQRFDDAKAAHQRAIELDSECTYAYYGLANACARLGLSEKSREHMERFRELKQADRETERERLAGFDDLDSVKAGAAFLHMAIAEVYRRLDVRGSAEEHLLRAVALAPDNLADRQNLAALYQQYGRLKEAVAVMRDLCQLQPDNVGFVLNLGILQAQQGDYAAAEQAFRTAIDRDPRAAAGYVALAQLLMQAGQRLVEARELAARAVSLDPSAPHYYLLSAVCHMSGDRASAAKAIRKAVELDPENAEYQQILSSLEASP